MTADCIQRPNFLCCSIWSSIDFCSKNNISLLKDMLKNLDEFIGHAEVCTKQVIRV